MKIYDLHGYRMSNAIALFHRILNDNRMLGQEGQVRLVTGHGEIRAKFVELANEYGLTCSTLDPGSLVITFE